MESDRVHARARDHARGRRTARTPPTAEGGWLDWLDDCGVPGDQRRRHARARPPHPRPRRDARRDLPGRDRRGRGARADRRRAVDGRAPTSPATVTPAEPVELDGDGPHVVGIDTGIKLSIVRQLRERGCRLTLLPCTASAEEVLARDPDLVFLANGPGDPAALDYVVDTVRELVGKRPVFGICLGHQLLCRAVGLETFKLPVRPPRRQPPGQGPARPGRIDITSQNHGFAVARARRRRARSRPTSRSAGRPTSAPPSSPT